jgi:hypothetical protein
MLASLKKAGFNDENTRITLFDNINTNVFEPYSCINSAIEQTREKYLIFCHQDVLFDQSDDYQKLVSLLAELDLLDPYWALAGNAGVNNMFRQVVRINDANHSPNWKGKFPQPVLVLDENFLVINVHRKIRCTKKLTGFHFYAHDLCLNAIYQGYSCYVINFYITHLSAGSFNDSFWKAKDEFYNYWSQKFAFCYIKTVTNIVMCLSKFKFLRLLGSFRYITKLLLLLNRMYPFLYPRANAKRVS